MQYAATIVLSSFLLFLVQPLVARLILPWFGGSAAVWTTCMLFFQALLLAGYAYAHFLDRHVRSRLGQAAIHAVLLVAAVALLPIAPAESWKPLGDEEPAGYIVRLLAVAVGLPYFLLASTSPLIQTWFSRARPGKDPYWLFALSNVASLAALIGYPFVVEPNLSAREQVTMWSWLFGAFAVVCAAVAWTTPPPAPKAVESKAEAVRAGSLVLWLSLSATGSILLLAVTNHLTQNVASVPLLWLAPLTLYLLSFILAFGSERWYRPRYWWPVVVALLGGMAWLIADKDWHFVLHTQLLVFLAGLFAGCMFCHGELYRLRPPPSQLTTFYLAVSAGGALGGVLVAIAAPLVFDAYLELGIGLVALAVLAAIRYARLEGRDGMVARYASLLAVAGVAGAAIYDAQRYHEDVRVSSRSFFGVLRVKEYGTEGQQGHLRRLVHGAIMHGEQYLHLPDRRVITTYYRPEAGIGAAILSKQEGTGPSKVGVVGLGTGTLAAYGRQGDEYRFYDIDRRVIELAKTEFTFLSDSAARIGLVLGDARLTLEREAPQGFDVLAIDAFSSDAIPVHLITREALRVYARHMKPDGIVAFHVSNRFLDLVPVVARLATEEGFFAVLVSDHPPEGDTTGRSQSDWVLVSRSKEALEHPVLEDAGAKAAWDRPEWRTWTDDYSNLVQILK